MQDRVDQHRRHQLHLPGTGAESRELGRDRLGQLGGLARAGGVQSTRRTKSGVSRFSTGTLRSSESAASAVAGSGQPGGGDRVALGPGARRRRTVGPRAPRGGSSLSGSSRAASQRVDPAVGVALGAAAVEAP